MSENSTLSALVTDASTVTVTVTVDEDGAAPTAGGAGQQLRFVLVPLAVIAGIMLLSAVVYMMARRRRLDVLRHRLMPLYNFDKAEHESDWETDSLNNIDNPNYTDYCTTKFIIYDE